MEKKNADKIEKTEKSKVKEQKKVRDGRNPKTNENLGTFEHTTAAHRAGKVKSKVPAYLKKKVKL